MEKGDKVICSNNKYKYFDELNFINPERLSVSLTIGGIYIITHLDEHEIWVVNDNGVELGYMRRRFVSLKEYRKRKLLKINGKICL